jgi:hypothetical protein
LSSSESESSRLMAFTTSSSNAADAFTNSGSHSLENASMNLTTSTKARQQFAVFW